MPVLNAPADVGTALAKLEQRLRVVETRVPTVTTGSIADDTVTSAKLTATGVTADTYADDATIPTFTVDSKGRLTDASNRTVGPSAIAMQASNTVDGLYLEQSGTVSVYPGTTVGDTTGVPFYANYDLDVGNIGHWQSGGWIGPRATFQVEGSVRLGNNTSSFAGGVFFQNMIGLQATVDGSPFCGMQSFIDVPLITTSAGVDATYHRSIDGTFQHGSFWAGPLFFAGSGGTVTGDFPNWQQRDAVTQYTATAFVGVGSTINRRIGVLIDDVVLSTDGDVKTDVGLWMPSIVSGSVGNFPFVYGRVDSTAYQAQLFSVDALGGVSTNATVFSNGRVFTGIGIGTSPRLTLALRPAKAGGSLNVATASNNVDVSTFAGSGVIHYNGDSSAWDSSGRLLVDTSDATAMVEYTGKTGTTSGTLTGCTLISGTGELYANVGADLTTGGLITPVGDAVSSGDELGNFVFRGWYDRDFVTATKIRSVATQDFTSTHAGGKIVLATVKNSTTTLVDRLTINHDGSIRMVPTDQTYTAAFDPLFGTDTARTLTLNYTSNVAPTFISRGETLVASQAPGAEFVTGYEHKPVVKVAFDFAPTAFDSSGFGFGDRLTLTVDTATGKTLGLYASFNAAPTVSRINSGTITTGAVYGFAFAPTVNTGVTLGSTTGLRVNNAAGSGTVTNQYGVYTGSSVVSVFKGGVYGSDANSGDLNLYSTQGTGGQIIVNDAFKILNSSFGSILSSAAATSDKTLTLPNVTDTVAVLGTAQSFSAVQTFPASGVIITGTKNVTLISGASSTDKNITFPNVSGTLAALNLAQNFTALQEFSAGISVNGTNTLTLPALTDTLATIGTDNVFTAAQTVAIAAGATVNIKNTSTPTALGVVGGDLNFQAISTGTTAVTGFQIHPLANENWDSTHQGTLVQLKVAKTGTGGLSVVQQWAMDLTTTFFGRAVYSNQTGTTLTYASPTSVDPSLSNVFKATTVNATGSVTFNLSTSPPFGQVLHFIIVNDATSGKTITFGTNFKSTGTLVGTTSQTRTITFISDGTNAIEVARTVAMA